MFVLRDRMAAAERTRKKEKKTSVLMSNLDPFLRVSAQVFQPNCEYSKVVSVISCPA